MGMVKLCAGAADRGRHLWVEVYVRIPRGRTLMFFWTRGMWCDVSVAGRPFRSVTGSL